MKTEYNENKTRSSKSPEAYRRPKKYTAASLLFLLLLLCTLMLSACGGDKEKPCEHQFGEWQTGEVNCVFPTENVRVCTICSMEQRITIPAKGHTEITVNEVASTCHSKGLSSHTKCKDCGAIITAPSTLPLAEHTPL